MKLLYAWRGVDTHTETYNTELRQCRRCLRHIQLHCPALPSREQSTGWVKLYNDDTNVHCTTMIQTCYHWVRLGDEWYHSSNNDRNLRKTWDRDHLHDSTSHQPCRTHNDRRHQPCQLVEYLGQFYLEEKSAGWTNHQGINTRTSVTAIRRGFNTLGSDVHQTPMLETGESRIYFGHVGR